MCYMSEHDARRARPARVGVRELRQNLSVYLRRVKDGEALEVTERGETVAELVPVRRRPLSILDQLIAEGKATPAQGDHRLLPPPPPPPAGYGGPTASEILQQMRDEERW